MVPELGLPSERHPPHPSHLFLHRLDGKIQMECTFPGCPVLPQSPREGKDGRGPSPSHTPSSPPMLHVLKEEKK